VSISFKEYLQQRRRTDTPQGDFVEDARRDGKLPDVRTWDQLEGDLTVAALARTPSRQHGLFGVSTSQGTGRRTEANRREIRNTSPTAIRRGSVTGLVGNSMRRLVALLRSGALDDSPKLKNDFRFSPILVKRKP